MIFTIKDEPENKRKIVDVNTDIVTLTQAANRGFKEYCTHLPKNLEAIQGTYLGSENRDNYQQFAGGSYDDLFKMPDMVPFEHAKQLLEKSSFMKKIVQKNNLINRRKRSFSEHEGEWSLDRKWEIKPFSDAKRLPTPAKFVDIYCYFNINCQVSQEQITRYGTVIWAMNTALETAGVNTRVFYVQNGEQVASSYNNNGIYVNTNIKILLKEPSKYISPVALAKCLTSNFYRRIIFSTMITAVDQVGAIHADNLGRAITDSKVIEFKNGQLHVWPDVLNAGNVNIEKTILDVIEKA